MKKKKVKRRKIKLVRSGWTESKLEKAERRFKTVKKHEIFLSSIVFWSVVFVVVLGNLMMSIALIPFLAVLNKLFLDLIIIVLGLVMGFLFNFLIRNVGHLEKHHHFLAGIILMVVAFANMFFMVMMANKMIEAVQIANVRHNPWVIGILYGAAFILPYLYYQLRKVVK